MVNFGGKFRFLDIIISTTNLILLACIPILLAWIPILSGWIPKSMKSLDQNHSPRRDHRSESSLPASDLAGFDLG